MRQSSPSPAAPFLSTLLVLAIGCIDPSTAPKLQPPQVSAGEIRGTSPPFRFETLIPGDAVAVHFDSRGCFHHVVADLILTRMEFGIRVTVVRATGIRVSSENLQVAESIDAESIDLEQLRGLDHVLDFYRKAQLPSICTTVDRVTFRVLSGALRDAEESYTDGSCGTLDDSHYYPVAGLLLFTRKLAVRGAT